MTGKSMATAAALAAAFGFLLMPASAGKLYWTDSGTVQRANLDGSDHETIYEGASNGSIALDLVNNKVYWATQSERTIRRANLDGSGAEDILTKLARPLAIAVDPAGGKVYWTDSLLDNIQRANLDGSDVEELVVVEIESSIPAMDLDVDGGKMYWADNLTRYVTRANFDGSDVEELSGDIIFPGGIDLDLVNDKIYWTGVFNAEPFECRLYRMNLDGSNRETLTVITEGFNAALGVALDVEAGHVYFTDYVNDRISRTDLEGDGRVTIVDGLITPFGLDIDLRDAPPCPADLDESGAVNSADLSILLGAWGTCPQPDDCPADLDGDGDVDAADLAQLLASWGDCP